MKLNILDPIFNGMGRSEFYRALIFPNIFPHEKPMLIENWSVQDREMYCGGMYTKGTA
jgi:hypothetical protein